MAGRGSQFQNLRRNTLGYPAAARDERSETLEAPPRGASEDGGHAQTADRRRPQTPASAIQMLTPYTGCAPTDPKNICGPAFTGAAKIATALVRN